MAEGPELDRPGLDREEVLRAHGYHRLRVKEVVAETSDSRSFVLDVPDEERDAFAYRAGQFCTFRVRIGGEEHARCYSMSSTPGVDDDLTVTVKRVPGGRVSNWLLDNVAPGAELEVSRPAGVFCVPEGAAPVVAFCGGSGVTPIMSIVKDVLATTERPVRVLYANRDRDSVIFEDQLADLARRHPDRLAVRHHLDADRGYLDAEEIAEFAAPDAGRADFFLCGPGPFMDLVESALLDAGVDRDRISLERFVNAGDPPPPAPDPEGAGGAEDDVPTEVTIILKGTPTTIDYKPGDTLLETARRAGLSPPFSCESGNCATCMGLLSEGSATMRVNNALTPEEVEEGWVLTCQSLPRGTEVTVEYENL